MTIFRYFAIYVTFSYEYKFTGLRNEMQNRIYIPQIVLHFQLYLNTTNLIQNLIIRKYSNQTQPQQKIPHQSNGPRTQIQLYNRE